MLLEMIPQMIWVKHKRLSHQIKQALYLLNHKDSQLHKNQVLLVLRNLMKKFLQKAVLLKILHKQKNHLLQLLFY